MSLPLLAVASSGPAWLTGLTLLVGAAAVYILLPRPRPFPGLWGVLLGLLALVLAGVFLVPIRPPTPQLPEAILFYAFSGIAVVSGCLLVTQRNPARAALSFALVVLSTCGLFLLLAAPFLMAATVIIYAGAIIVTFLFVLMLAQQEGLSNADARSREPFLSTCTAFLLLFALLNVLERGNAVGRQAEEVLQRSQEAQEHAEDGKFDEILAHFDDQKSLFHQYHHLAVANGWDDLRRQTEELATLWDAAEPREREQLRGRVVAQLKNMATEVQARAASLGLLSPPKLPLSALSGPPANTPWAEVRRDPQTGLPQVPAENSAYLGRSLFTDYLLPVELGGMLLLVATIGAIAIAHRRPGFDPEAPL